MMSIWGQRYPQMINSPSRLTDLRNDPLNLAGFALVLYFLLKSQRDQTLMGVPFYPAIQIPTVLPPGGFTHLHVLEFLSFQPTDGKNITWGSRSVPLNSGKRNWLLHIQWAEPKWPHITEKERRKQSPVV